MGGDSSAFAALGLEPGADRAAVERAYKRLIKDHHPDRAGGDAARAAEINRAYRELRDGQLPRDGLEFHDIEPHGAGPRPGGAWKAVAIGLAAAAIALVFLVPRNSPLVERTLGQGIATGGEPMHRPLAVDEISGAVRDAARIARNGDEMALSAASRTCQGRLRSAPSIALLDRCAAFDDAVVILQDRDPLRDRGEFSELAVTGRQWSAAKALSDDFVAIDSRLGQVRVRVELLLAGSAAQPA